MDPELKEMLAAIMARLDKLETAKEPVKDAELTDAQKAEKAAADEEAAKAKEPVKDAEVIIPADGEVAEKAAEVSELASDLQEIAEELTAAADSKLKGKLKGIAAKLKTGTAAIKTLAATDAKERASLAGRLKALETKPAMDERTLVDITARRTGLVDRLTKHVGTFDHAQMTTDEVAAYGIAKLEIKGVAKGQEIVALDAFLQAKGDPTKTTVIVAQDKAPSALSARIAKHGAGE